MIHDKNPEDYRSSRYDDPSAKLWSAYLSKAEKCDKTLAQNWKGDMDSILIFAGLFSASLTAFIIESYRTLSPDPNDVNAFLLLQIVHQLSTMSNATTLSTPPVLDPIAIKNPSLFAPSSNSMICNTLWFLSLAFSLACALTATLVESWSRHFLLAGHNRPAPQDRARISAYLYQGIKTYGMAAVVEAIPMLLHISLFLFFAGLFFFLLPVNVSIAYLMLGILIVCCILYTVVTFLPISYLDCPYWTPISSMWWHFLRRLNLLWHRDIYGQKLLIVCSMKEAREIVATEITATRDERDIKAMCWTIRALREDGEFEPFVEVIPNVVSGLDFSAKLLMHNLLCHEDITVRLGYRISRLLGTCNSGFLEHPVANNRAITCLKAIWSLTMLSIPQQTPNTFLVDGSRPRFNEDTLHLVNLVQMGIPSVDDYAASAATVVARSLIDGCLETVQTVEEQLTNLIQDESEKLEPYSNARHNAHSPNSHIERLSGVNRSVALLGEQVAKVEFKMTTPLPLISMKSIAVQYSRFLRATFGSPLDESYVGFLQDLLTSLHNFQNIANEAGFSLALHYISRMLSSHSLPHEASNTLRRIFFRLNLSKPVSRSLQSQFVTHLEEALDYDPVKYTTRLPRSTIDILLNLTRFLDDPTCITKAGSVITHYLKFVSDDAAVRSLLFLTDRLPLHARSLPPLDLYSCHMYTNTKAVRPS